MGICTKEDGYIYELFEFNARWVVELSDGTCVFQDDDRPGEPVNSAWIRLGKHVRDNKLSIENMRIQFRSNVIPVNDGPVDGFFFVKSALGAPGLEKSIDYYVVGTLKNGILQTKRYQLLELKLDETEIRDPVKSGDCLILNYGKEIQVPSHGQ